MFRNLLNMIRFDSFSSILLANTTIENVTSRETAQPIVTLLYRYSCGNAVSHHCKFHTIRSNVKRRLYIILYIILKGIVNILTSLSIA